MISIEELKRAKESYDYAWDQAVKYGCEAREAMEQHRRLTARDTDSIFMRKAARARTAQENWARATGVAEKVMNEFYDQFRPDKV